MASTNDRADAALDEVLSGTPAVDQPTEDTGVSEPDTPEPLDAGTIIDPDRSDTAEVCTVDEARELVDKARAAIVTVDEVMGEIIRRRAWIAMGYDEPREFWIKEFGPDADHPAYGRAQVYRTARVLTVIYAIQQRVGDPDLALSVSEYALRQIPAGKDGINDEVLVEAIGRAVDDLPEDATGRDVQDIVNDKIKLAREKHAAEAPEMPQRSMEERLAALSFPMPDADSLDDDPDDFDDNAEQAPAGLDDEPVTPNNTGDPESDTSSGSSGSSGGPDHAGVSLAGYEPVDEAALRQTFQIQKLRKAITALSEITPTDVPALIEHLSVAEKDNLTGLTADAYDRLTEVIEQATNARQVVDEVDEHAATGDEDVELEL